MDEKFWQSTVLFRGASTEQMEDALDWLRAERRLFEKGEVIRMAGERTDAMGLVLSGSVNIEFDDVWGNKTVLDNVGAGQVFAETYACLSGEPLMVSAVAAGAAEVLFLHTERLLDPEPQEEAQYGWLLRNLLRAAAQKNLILSRRMFHISSKTIRGRLLSYLSEQAIRQHSSRFDIPFDRQQLADYLGVDRSALSAELGKLRDEGMLAFRKNHFELKTENK